MVASKLHLASFAYATSVASFAWPKFADCIFCIAACFAFYTVIISVSIIEPDVVCFPHVNMNIMQNVKGWDKQGNKVQVITYVILFLKNLPYKPLKCKTFKLCPYDNILY